MFKVNNKDTRMTAFIVNFEHISLLVLVFLLLTLNMQLPTGLQLRNSSRTLPSAIWQIFYEFLIFNSKICATSKIFFILHEEPCDNYLITSTETNLTGLSSSIVLSLCFYLGISYGTDDKGTRV